MSGFEYVGEKPPYRRWWGPYSAATGTTYGFRVREGKFGVWHRGDAGLEFWTAPETPAVLALIHDVQRAWRGGGRLLLLPNGYIVKPLQNDGDRNIRAFIGTFRGSLVVRGPRGECLNYSDPARVQPGEEWSWPNTTGLAAVMQEDGALRCSWVHPDDSGKLKTECLITGANAKLYAGFRLRRIESTGRVHIHPGGHVTQNCDIGFGNWRCRYVGRLGLGKLDDWSGWVGKERIR